MKNKKNLSKILICLTLIILTLKFASSEIIIEPQEKYLMNEPLTITISNIANASHLTINSDHESHKIIGISQNIIFIPRNPEIYTLTLLDNQKIIEIKTIEIMPVSNESIYTNKEEYNLSETVNIIITANYSGLDIISPAESYRYLGEQKQKITFIPKTEGEYSVIIYDEKNEAKGKTDFIVISETSQTKNEDTQTQTQTSSDLESFRRLSNPFSELFTSKKNVTIQPRITNSLGQTLTAEIKTKNENYKTNNMRNLTLENRQENLEITISDKIVKKIIFNKINLENGLELGFEEIDKTQVNIKNLQIVSVFAIDPTKLDFDYANVTFSAQAQELYKCAEWNFTEQHCYGEWKKIMNMNEGENHTFQITPNDPAYAQITRNADNCYKEPPAATCNAGNITAISANGGTNVDVSRRMAVLRVSFANSTNDIDQIVNCIIQLDAQDNQRNNWTVQPGNYTGNTWSAGTSKEIPNAEANITWDCTPYFTSITNDQAAFNDFGIRITSNDAGANAVAYLDWARIWINYTIWDNITPYYYNISAYPASPANYSSTQNYRFNTTWTDNEGINATWIEHNLNATAKNYSMSGNISSVHFYDWTYGIAAGVYSWKTCANDSKNNINCTPSQTYTVNKATPILNLTLNGQNNPITIERETNATINATIYDPIGGYLELYQNGTTINTGYGSLQNIINYTNQSDYNITLKYFITENYTQQIISYTLSVRDTIAPDNITKLADQSNTSSSIYWNWTNPTNNDFDHAEIYLNGVFQTNATVNYYNATGLFSDTDYEIEIRPVDKYGNTGSYTNDSAKTKSSSDTTPPTIFGIINHSITDTSAIINWTTDEAATSYVFYGITSLNYPNLTYSDILLADHSIILSNLKSATTYYYIVNSTDSAANSNQSVEYSFTTLQDETPPIGSNPQTYPASPSTYSPSQQYQFNTTWIDNEGISQAFIEHNLSGVLANYSMTGNLSSTYFYDWTSGLAAGNYQWMTWANDTSNNMNNISWQIYTVNKAASNTELLLNGTSANHIINESQAVNITAKTLIGNNYLELYQDGFLINNGTQPLTNITTYYVPGTYLIKAVQPESQNYTGSLKELNITVKDIFAPFVNLTSPQQNYIDRDGQLILDFSVNDTGTLDSCNLFINNMLNDTKPIFTKGTNTFTYTGINGNYDWNISCNDSVNNLGYSQTFNFTINISTFYPVLFPINCSDADGTCNVTKINFSDTNYEAHGNLPRPGAAYVYINFTNQTNIPQGSTIEYINITYNKYQATTAGNFRLEWLNTTSSTWMQICQNNFAAISNPPTYDPVNCGFTDLGNAIPTVTQINNGLKIRAIFNHTSNPNNVYYGTEYVSISLKYTEDNTPPTVELTSPNDHSFGSVGDTLFGYRPSDPNLANCTIYGDFSGAFLPNLTNTTPISNEINDFIVDLKAGYYNWNVLCFDIAGNNAFASANWSINITNPDLYLLSQDITFSNDNPMENEIITIFATITNQGDVNASTPFNNSFYDGNPSSGGIQIGTNITINELGYGQNITINTTWTVSGPGPHNIFVLTDTPTNTNGTIKETNENNNIANKTLTVDAWSLIYGNFSGNIILAEKNNISFDFWENTEHKGNVYVLETGSSINWEQLQALGRKTNNDSALNDFTELDAQLNMQNYPDSISNRFTNDFGQTPKNIRNMTIYNIIINDVPIINSSTSNNFMTGILWDRSDGGQEYDGTQDIVFITELNPAKQGRYATYDYEIILPVNLRDYHETTYHTLSYFYELG